MPSMQTLMIVSGLIGAGVFVWGIWAALAARDRRTQTDRRTSLRVGSPGRRLSDLVTLPSEPLRH